MKHFYYAEIPLEDIASPAVGAKRRWLVDAGTGAPNFTVAEVEVMPGGSTLHHSHPYEHAMFILEGTGEVDRVNGHEPYLPLGRCSTSLPTSCTRSRNTGGKMLRFLSIEPVMKEEKKP